jgi:HK97 family phage major capsid protein
LIYENVKLRQERGAIVARMKALGDKEVREGKLSDGEKSEFGRLDKEQRELSSRIERIEGSMQLHAEMRASAPPPNGHPGGWGEEDPALGEYRKAFGRYLRRGRTELSAEDRSVLKLDKLETRDMGAGGLAAGLTGATGGAFFVPVGFVRKIEDALKYYGPMLAGTGDGRDGFPTILDTDTGQPLPWPTSNDTTTMAELIGEGQQVTTADINIGMVQFGAWKLSSKLVKISLELLEDSAFDLENFLVQEFGKRIGRAVNSYGIIGTGVSQPMGLATAVLASGPKTTAVGASSNDGSSAADTVGSDDLTNVEHSVDPLYRPNASYLMHDSTLAAIKKVKDKYGRPLWQPSPSEKAPGTINGYRVLTTPYMDQLQTQASSPVVTRNTVLFGALDKFTIRRVRGLSVLRLSERFADFGQIAFLGFYRFDSQLLDAGTHPVGLLQNIY